MPDKHELILLPRWAIELCDAIEPKATVGELAQRIAEGKIKPTDSLQYDLGISPTELASLSQKINELIDSERKTSGHKYVTAAQLYGCKTVVDLMNLVFACM